MYLECKRYNIESESILNQCLSAFQEGETKNESDNSCQLWKSTINYSVPNQEDHEFWKQDNLDSIHAEIEHQKSTLLQITAFGSTKQEATAFSMMKLINLIQLLKELLRKREEINDMESLISKLIRNTARPSFLNINSDITLNIGAQLYNCYLQQYYEVRKKADWNSIAKLIKEFSKTCSSELHRLLKYYFVINLLTFF